MELWELSSLSQFLRSAYSRISGVVNSQDLRYGIVTGPKLEWAESPDLMLKVDPNQPFII